MLSRREMGALCAALLLCFLLSLGAGWAKGQLDAADALAADTLRLHIRADTNAVRDQSAKLAVRDAVLALADESCPADGKADAKVWAASNLVRLELTAREVLAARGTHAPVHACLVNMYFPTRRYGSGALPAGRYDAVRIELGSGAGRNWWCVLYPGLCRAACSRYALPEENDHVCGEYLLRFKVVERVQQRTARREDVVLVG